MSSKKIQSLFAAQQEEFGDARADTGSGGLGPWPSEGEHGCYLMDITVDEDAEFYYGSREDNNDPLPAAEIRFHFQLMDDPDNETDDEDQNMQWGGQPFKFPYDMGPISGKEFEGKRKALEIARNRLCGHLATVLDEAVGGEDGISLDEALNKALEVVRGEEQICVQVDCRYRKGKKRSGEDTAPVYKTEYLKEKLSG